MLRTPADVAAEYATNERIERTADDLTAAEVTPTADAIRTRLVADLARERYADPRGPAGPVTATQAFQPTVATHVQRYLGELRCRTG